MRRFIIVLLLFYAPLAAAQFTLTSGTITDPQGFAYANGTITPTLVISGSPRFSSTGYPYSPPTQATGLDAKGTFAFQLADVHQLAPAGGTWSFHICSAAGTVQPGAPITAGPVCFDLKGVVITGNTMDITAQIEAVPPPPLTTITTGSGQLPIPPCSITPTGTLFCPTIESNNFISITSTPGPGPTCFNGPNGALTNVGCSTTSGGVTGSGTAGLVPVWTGPTSLGNSPISASQAEIQFGTPASLNGPQAFLELSQFNGSGTICPDTPSIPFTTPPCVGYRLSDQPQPTSNLGYMAGLAVLAENTQHNTSKLLGIYANAASGTSGTTTDEYGAYLFAEESIVTTVTNRHGLFAFAYNDTPNTTALNEGIVTQTGGDGGTTNTLDYTLHVLAPFAGDTLTTHAGIAVEPQGTGVPLQLKPQSFSTLDACSATYEGSRASVSDSTTGTPGGIITGGGANHVSAYCNGTNWVVVGGGAASNTVITSTPGQLIQVLDISPCNTPACSATFPHTFTSTPKCVATGHGGSVDINTTAPPSTTTITLNSSGVATATVWCIGAN